MIRVGIVGYGNVGKAVECVLMSMDDMQLTAIFSNRAKYIESASGVNIYDKDDVVNWKNKIDILILCTGSHTNVKETPLLSRLFHVVDAFDMHEKMEEHWKNVTCAASETGHLACIGAGWDPGLFSLFRLYGNAFFNANVSTFWGKGISSGHSKAIRMIDGVKDARQYTIPKEEAMKQSRKGNRVIGKNHIRECYVVLEEGICENSVKQQIMSMPYYFEGYETIVHFVDEKTLEKHNCLYHEGHVIAYGRSGFSKEYENKMECRVSMDSNPSFTASILCVVARAVYRMAKEHRSGCITMFDIAPFYYSEASKEYLYFHVL